MSEIMICAGEVSGDRNAALLAERLLKMDNISNIWGIGGPELSALGVEILCNPLEKSVMGIIEPVKRLGFFLSLLNMVKREIKKRKPDLIILVDFTAFNMKLAKFAAKENIPALSFFSPSAWVWRQGRAGKMAKWNIKIAAVFPMEYEVYRKAGADVRYVGHPLPSMIKIREKKPNFRKNLSIDGNTPIIGILPGSREMEVKALFPEFLKAAKIIYNSYKCCFIIPVASDHLRSLIETVAAEIKKDIPLYIIDGMSLDVMENSNLIITASGTTTLEASCIGVPLVVAYKTSLITWMAIRLLVKVKYMALPNLILEEEAVPEFFQKRANACNISDAALKLLLNPSLMKEIKSKLSKVSSKLGDGSTLDLTSQYIQEILTKP